MSKWTIDVTETKGINDDLCAHSIKGFEVGTDVACINDIKSSSSTCNSTFLECWSNIIICLTKSKIGLDMDEWMRKVESLVLFDQTLQMLDQ